MKFNVSRNVQAVLFVVVDLKCIPNSYERTAINNILR